MVSRAAVGALFAAAVVLAAGCERDPIRIEPAGPDITVFGVLRAGDIFPTIIIARIATPGPGEIGSPQLAPLDGVIAELIGETHQISLHADGSGLGYHGHAAPAGIVPGERYELRAALPDGRVVVGSATVPARPVLIEPEDGDRIPARWESGVMSGHERTHIAWEHDTGAHALGLSAWVIITYADDNPYPFPPECRIGGSSSILFPPVPAAREWRLSAFDCGATRFGGSTDLRPDSIVVDLMVSAHDSAYVRYFDAWERSVISHRDLAVNLTGAFGLFSAYATTTRRIILFEAPEP